MPSYTILNRVDVVYEVPVYTRLPLLSNIEYISTSK